MARNFKVGTLLLTSQEVIASGNTLFVNSQPLVTGIIAGNNITVSNNDKGAFTINGSAGGGSSLGVTGISITGSTYFSGVNGQINLTGAGNVYTLLSGSNTIFISGDLTALSNYTGYQNNNPSGYATTSNLQSTGQTLYNYITNTSGNLNTRIQQTGANLYALTTGWNSKSITIENPIPGDNISLFQTSNTIQVQRVRSVVRGLGLASGLFSIRFDPDRSVVGTELLNNGFSTTGRTTGDSFSTFTNSTISGNNWAWISINATGQTLSGLSMTMFYNNLY